MLQSTPHPAKQGLRTLSNPIKLDGRRLAGKVGSALGADTDDILGQLGYSAEELTQLRTSRVI